MKTEIIISGFGGQGVLSMGKILAYSGLMEDKEVTWMPAYGPEQRGGTANVTVIVSDSRISSPILSHYDVAIVLNQPSLDKFEPKIKPGGILIYDGYGVMNPPQRKDITIYRIDAIDGDILALWRIHHAITIVNQDAAGLDLWLKLIERWLVEHDGYIIMAQDRRRDAAVAHNDRHVGCTATLLWSVSRHPGHLLVFHQS